MTEYSLGRSEHAWKRVPPTAIHVRTLFAPQCSTRITGKITNSTWYEHPTQREHYA